MDIVKDKYERVCKWKSDINQHLPTLCKYAKECTSVMELGVRGVVSTWAFLWGLLQNQKSYVPRILIVNDIQKCNLDELMKASRHLPVVVKAHWGSDLEMPIDHAVDLVFIDTWHVYGQLKRELERFAPYARKYIIMHDTETFGRTGEAKRKGNVKDMMRQTGYTQDEVEKGLLYALEEFMEAHADEWEVAEVFTNNNGLTVLRRRLPLRST